MLKKIVFLFLCQLGFAQDFIYHGVVTDEGMPLPGASIVIKGTKIGTETDFDGKYSIRVKVGDVLLINFIGMETTNYTIKPHDYRNHSIKQIKINKKISQRVDGIESDDFKNAISKKDSIKPSQSNGRVEGYFQANDILKFYKKNNIYIQKTQNNIARLNIDYSTNFLIGLPIRLYEFQNTYAQGRSLNNQWQYQGPETNEIYSWGSSINSLSMGNNSTEYYPNGAIESNTFGNKVPTFDRNDLFSNTIQFTNNLGLTLILNSNQQLNLKISNQKFYNTFNELQNDDSSIALGFKNIFYKHTFKANLMYDRSINNFNNNNFMVNKIIYSNAITPSHFNSKLNAFLSNGTQRNFTNFYNNPYFLLKTNQDIEKTNNFNLFLEDYYRKRNIENTLSSNVLITNNLQQFAQSNNYAGISNTNLNKREEFFLQNTIQNNLKWNIDYERIVVTSNTQFNYQERTLKRNFWIDNFQNNTFQSNQNRFSIHQSFGFSYNFNELLDINRTILFETKPSLLISNTLDKKLAFNFYNSLEIQHLFRFLNISLSHDMNNFEPSLRQNNLNFNTLNQSISDINIWNNNQELVLPNRYKPTTKNETSLVFYSNWFKYDFKLKLYYETTKNEYAPIAINQNFHWLPAFDYQQKGIELNASMRYHIANNLDYTSSINFETFANKVRNIHTNNGERIPFAGFQEVSKNYIINQPLGVILGNKYARNQDNKLIMGSDGFPLVADGLQIMGNPNPDFIISSTNNFKYKNWSLSFTLQYQKGGHLWDGTQQTLNYFGVSEQTAQERNFNNYNPQLPISENKWVKKGFAGVTEDAKIDASYLNINEINISYDSSFFINKTNHVNYKIQLFVNNVFLWSKSKNAMVNQQLFEGSETAQLNFFNAPLVQTYGININIKL